LIQISAVLAQILLIPPNIVAIAADVIGKPRIKTSP
jgi:hypothetical protein